MVNESGQEMDYEWMKLILEAKKLGITREEIRVFFRKYRAYQASIKKEIAAR